MKVHCKLQGKLWNVPIPLEYVWTPLFMIGMLGPDLQGIKPRVVDSLPQKHTFLPQRLMVLLHGPKTPKQVAGAAYIGISHSPKKYADINDIWSPHDQKCSKENQFTKNFQWISEMSWNTMNISMITFW